MRNNIKIIYLNIIYNMRDLEKYNEENDSDMMLFCFGKDKSMKLLKKVFERFIEYDHKDDLYHIVFNLFDYYWFELKEKGVTVTYDNLEVERIRHEIWDLLGDGFIPFLIDDSIFWIPANEKNVSRALINIRESYY